MKRMSALALAVAVPLFACSNSSGPDDDGDGNGSFSNQASATINSTSWSATSVLSNRVAAAGFVTITFVAHGPNDSHVSFGIANASVGTFSVAEGTANQADFKFGGKSYGQGESGTIRIDAITATGMRGSFTISAKTTQNENGSASGTFEAAF